MTAPMGEIVKRLLADDKKARILTGQILYARSKGLKPVIRIGNKRYELSRVSSISTR